MTDDAADFECVICQRHVDMRWYRTRNPNDISPVCRGCERSYGATPPKQGAFRDRRIATQISAIANALDHEAYHQAHPWRL